MTIRKIIFITLISFFFLVVLAVVKSVKAQAPPPASRTWMFARPKNSRKVKVKVIWQENGQTKNFEMTEILSDLGQ